MKKPSKKNSLALASSGIGKALNSLLPEIRSLIESARHQAVAAANLSMVSLYWNIGRIIQTELQRHEGRADYGNRLVENLGKKLSIEYGSGFSARVLWDMKRFFTVFEILPAASTELKGREILPAVSAELYPAQKERKPSEQSGDSMAIVQTLSVESSKAESASKS